MKRKYFAKLVYAMALRIVNAPSPLWKWMSNKYHYEDR